MAGRSYSVIVMWLVAGFTVLVAGCGGESHNVTPVKGFVTYQGSPVEGAVVAFHAVDAAVGEARMATGVTDAEGRFQLTSFTQGDGAAPGSHKVTVSKKSTTAAVTTGPV